MNSSVEEESRFLRVTKIPKEEIPAFMTALNYLRDVIAVEMVTPTAAIIEVSVCIYCSSHR